MASSQNWRRSLTQAFQKVEGHSRSWGAGGAPSARMLMSGVIAAGGLAAVGLGVYHSFYRVDPGHASVIFSRWSGMNPQVYNEGLQFKVPWLHIPRIFATRVRPTTYGTLTGSKDLQTINITLRILYKPMMDRLSEIAETLGEDYDERVLPSIANEVLKSVVAKFNASQLIMERELVSRMIQQRLVERAKEFYMELEDVSITHLSFSPEYARAVERKQVAQQEAERAKYTVERAQQEKRSIVIKAEGDAESARLVSEAILSNPYFLEMRRLEAAKEIAGIVASSNNTVYTSSDTLLFNLLQPSTLPPAANKK